MCVFYTHHSTELYSKQQLYELLIFYTHRYFTIQPWTLPKTTWFLTVRWLQHVTIVGILVLFTLKWPHEWLQQVGDYYVLTSHQ